MMVVKRIVLVAFSVTGFGSAFLAPAGAVGFTCPDTIATAMDTDTAVRVSLLRCGLGNRRASPTPASAPQKMATKATRLATTEFIDAATHSVGWAGVGLVTTERSKGHPRSSLSRFKDAAA